MTTIIQLRRGTSTEWTTANPVLALGEAGIETNTLTWKVGDGVTAWNSLAYMSGGGGNVTYGNTNVAAFLAAFGSNVLVTTGNVSGGNVLAGGIVSATGNVRGANINTTGLVSATGNVTGGNVLTAGQVSATGNITGSYILGNGSQLTGLPATSTGNIGFDNTIIYSVNGNAISIDPSDGGGNTGYIYVPGPSNASSNPLVVENQLQGNVEITSYNNTWTFDSTGNLTVPTNTWFLTEPGSDGNIGFHTDGNGFVKILGSNDVLLELVGDTANALNRIEIDTFGEANTLGGTFTGRFARGTFGSPAAVQGDDQLAVFKGKGYDGSNYTPPAGRISIDAFSNWSPGNTPTRISFWTTRIGETNANLNMQLNPNGNLTIFNGNINLLEGGAHMAGGTTTGNGALYAGLPTYTILGSDVVAQFSGNVNSYSQLNFQNISNGTQASGDFIITANNGTDSANFIDMGIAGNNWDGTQPNSLGANVGPNDGYLYVNGGNLVVGTDVSNWKFNSSGSFVQAPVPYANLTAVAGGRAFVNNANLVASGNFGAQIDGSGSNTVPVWSDGSNWYIG